MHLPQKQHNVRKAVILTTYHGLLSQNTLSLFELYSKQYYRQYTLMLPKNENRWLIMIFNQLSHKSSLIFTIEVWAYEESNLKLIIVSYISPNFWQKWNSDIGINTLSIIILYHNDTNIFTLQGRHSCLPYAWKWFMTGFVSLTNLYKRDFYNTTLVSTSFTTRWHHWFIYRKQSWNVILFDCLISLFKFFCTKCLLFLQLYA